MKLRFAPWWLLLAAAPAPAPAHEPHTPLALAAADATLEWGPCPAFMPEGCEIAVLHGDPAQPNADVFLRVPGNSVIAKHWHTSAERMVLVAGRMTVEYDGAAPATLAPGSYAYGPAKLAHAATCAAGEPCVLFVAFEGPVDAHPVE